MRTSLFKYIVAAIFCLTFFSQRSNAQFKEEAFTQNYNESGDTLSRSDTVEKLFSIKEFAGALAHKNTMKIGTMFIGSAILPGTAQIYNKDYWKLPIIYIGIGSLAGTGGYYLKQYSKSIKAYDNYMLNKNAFESTSGYEYPFSAPVVDLKAKNRGTWLLAGAGLLYWGSLMDGVICYDSPKNPDPGRATLFSALLPGLGQIYNGELFKVPIYWGALACSSYLLVLNNTNYVRFKRIHNQATSTDPNISGKVPIPGETAKWYRDVYRRYRDYSIVATVALYLLQVIDANVFAYMHDFEVDDALSINLEPSIIAPNNAYALNMPSNGSQSAVGIRMGITF